MLFSAKISLDSSQGEGIVNTIVEQGKTWRIHFDATEWNAKSVYPAFLFPGDSVRVVGRQNITLLVEPEVNADERH
jgi:membrane protein implicated in regulation of membrane protease activity